MADSDTAFADLLRQESMERPGDYSRRIETVRAAVSEELDFRSLRQVARAVGMSPTGLQNFRVAEAMPHAPTMAKLWRWYETQHRAGSPVAG